ncbi:MAG: radical SAM protein [Euryarchaeota archaeon]|nr:radical SAM protein [Euryarchaeota archaeon]
MAEPQGGRFLVSEIYKTIQGESSLVGVPTVFVRLYSCNLRCVWCDSMHAVEGGEYQEVSVEDVVQRVLDLAGPSAGRHGVRNVCWTGGEPLLQWRSIGLAMERLPEDYVHSIETDGEVPLEPFSRAVAKKRERGLVRYIMDVKCPGSGMKAKLAFENLRHLRPEDEVKFVLLDRADYEFAREVVLGHEVPAGTILFSPATPAHKVEKGLDPAKLAAWILEDGLGVRLQLQVHKVIWPGVDRGI